MVGEELGLLFTMGVVVTFTVIFIAGLVHLRRAPNLFHFLLVLGCVLLICLQAIINLGVVTGDFSHKRNVAAVHQRGTFESAADGNAARRNPEHAAHVGPRRPARARATMREVMA